MDGDDKVKTGCMGVLLPIVLAAFGVHRIMHPPKVSYLFHTPIDPRTRIPTGIVALGMALVAHGLCFVPYERIRGLKYVIALLGVGVFFLGLSWEQINK